MDNAIGLETVGDRGQAMPAARHLLPRMRNGGAVSIAMGVLLLAVALPAQRAAPRVWATHDGTRVMRDGPPHPDRDSNAVWNGHEIRLLAARNEIVAFQVIVEASDAISSLSAAFCRWAASQRVFPV